MKLDKNTTGIISSYKVTSKSIKTPEDEKIQKRVAIVKIEREYVSGDLSEFLPADTTDDVLYSTCTWGERTGKYLLNINDVEFSATIQQITRKNKDDGEAKYTITFETEDLETVSGISHYVKDKDNPSQITLKKAE